MKTIEWKDMNIDLGMTLHFETINKNHLIMQCTDGKILFSYNTPVAVWMNGQLYLTDKHDYSTTTNKNVKEFTQMSKAERNQALENEEATLIINY